MYVVFIHGPTASGKFTVAKSLSDLTGLPLFHNHLTVDLVSSLFDFGSPSFVRFREYIWLKGFEEAATSDQSFIFTFHPEATVNPSFIGQAKAAITKNDGRIYFVKLTCPENEIESRIENPSRGEFGKLNSKNVYRQLRSEGAFDFPQLPTPLVTIATNTSTPEEAAQAIKDRVSRAQ